MNSETGVYFIWNGVKKCLRCMQSRNLLRRCSTRLHDVTPQHERVWISEDSTHTLPHIRSKLFLCIGAHVRACACVCARARQYTLCRIPTVRASVRLLWANMAVPSLCKPLNSSAQRGFCRGMG